MRSRTSKMTRVLRRAKPSGESLRTFARRTAVQDAPPDSDDSHAAGMARLLKSAAARWIARKGFAA